jgi:hypothetical protein
MVINMLYTVDEIIDDIVVLENRDNLEMIKVNKNILPKDIHEGSIIEYKDNIYINRPDIENNKRKELIERFKNLRSE